MKITITGTTSKKLKATLTEAANFFADQLMDPRTVRNIELDIELMSHLDVNGECINEDDNRNPRWFTINLKKDPADTDILQVLAHEMVHVKQYAKNELKPGIMVPTRGGLKMTSKWMGKIWKPKAKEDTYFDSPWEVEAFGREVGLIHKWYAHKNG